MGKGIERLSVYFQAPHRISTVKEDIPKPSEGQVIVQTLTSAISSGTELLFYRNQIPSDIAVDETFPSMSGRFAYPLKYGYASVGKVFLVGKGVSLEWKNRLVFVFHPHESHFAASVDDLIPLPDDMDPKDAVFLPSMETAVSLLLDGGPLIGEKVAVFGQGVIGLLTSALLGKLPLGKLISVDKYLLRRKKSMSMGVGESFDALSIETTKNMDRLIGRDKPCEGFDLSYELSGDPAALGQAIDITCFNGRVVIGSWYGRKKAALALGRRFHRSRIRLISSQVSTISPERRGNWTKQRQFETALRMIKKIRPSALITHCFPVEKADKAYQLLDKSPERTIQVILTYGGQP